MKVDTRPCQQATIEFLAAVVVFYYLAAAGSGLLLAATISFGLFIGYFIRWRADLFKSELESASRLAEFLSRSSKSTASATAEATEAIARARLASFKAVALRALVRRLQVTNLNLVDYNLTPQFAPVPSLF